MRSELGRTPASAVEPAARDRHVEIAPQPTPAAEIAQAPLVDRTEGIPPAQTDGGEEISRGKSEPGSRNDLGSDTESLKSLAKPIYAPAPEYPAEARREKWQGTVLLRVLVGRYGRADKVEIGRSSGFETLDRAALEAVEQWRFHPASSGDRSMEEWVGIPIVFHLEDPNR